MIPNVGSNNPVEKFPRLDSSTNTEIESLEGAMKTLHALGVQNEDIRLDLNLGRHNLTTLSPERMFELQDQLNKIKELQNKIYKLHPTLDPKIS